MLRNYVGDSAFFKSLNLYLQNKKFSSAEAQDLRLALKMLQVRILTGSGTNGTIAVVIRNSNINYDYDVNGKTAKVFVKQTQSGKVFKLPVAIDVYQGTEKTRYKVWAEHQADTFIFHTVSKPALINVDGDKILLCEKNEHKTLDNYIFQY